MLPDGELRSSRPKIYRARAAMICAALAFRGFVVLVAGLAIGGFGYFSWSEAARNQEPVPWLKVAGSAIAVLLFAWSGISWARTMIGTLGQKLTLDADGISLERRGESCRFLWSEIARVDRNDHLNAQSNSHGIVVGLVQNYWGWMSRSKLTVHAADGRKILVTPFFERYDEMCGYVIARQKRAARNAAADD